MHVCTYLCTEVHAWVGSWAVCWQTTTISNKHQGYPSMSLNLALAIVNVQKSVRRSPSLLKSPLPLENIMLELNTKLLSHTLQPCLDLVFQTTAPAKQLLQPEKVEGDIRHKEDRLE